MVDGKLKTYRLHSGSSSAIVAVDSNNWAKERDLASVDLHDYNRVFPKIDHSDIDARIVLEQNKFSKKVTSNRD